MKKAAFFLGFGLLPFWVAIGIVMTGSLSPSRPFEYWAVAPWLIILAAPVCIVTLAITALTLVIHERVSGNRSHKNKIAFISFLSLVLVAGGIISAIWLAHEHRQQDIVREEGLAMDFVKHSNGMHQVIGGDFDVYPSVRTGSNNGLPIKYEFSVRPKKSIHSASFATTVYVIVHVSRPTGTALFTLDCITPLSMGQRDPFKDPCTSSSATHIQNIR